MSNVVAAWHRLVETKDLSLLDALVADDAVFHSPVVFKPQEGKALTIRYLKAAIAVLGNDTFRYVADWSGKNSAVLEFRLDIDGIDVDGADFITWDEHDRIVDFKVMIRPLKAINVVLQKMGEELGKAPR